MKSTWKLTTFWITVNLVKTDHCRTKINLLLAISYKKISQVEDKLILIYNI